MSGYVIQRLLGTIPILIGVGIVTFVLVRVLPGDPAVFYVTGPVVTQEAVQAVREALGLDQPLYLQLFHYFGQILTGDLGRSLTTGQAVTVSLMQRLPASLELSIVAMTLAIALSIPLGIIAATRLGTWSDYAIRFAATVGVSLPASVLGILLILVFYYYVGFAPDPIGRLDPFVATPQSITGFLLIDSLLAGNLEAFRSAAAQVALPALTVALVVMGPILRITRSSMVDVLTSDYIRTCRAAGFNWWTTYVRYGLRNALLPVLTTVGLIIAYLIGANVVVEKLFAWPGVGAYSIDALLASDYAPVQGYMLLMTALFVVINTMVDVLSALVDPRVRAQ
nr:ABC transporter permease [Sinorhizobium psoraleae]